MGLPNYNTVIVTPTLDTAAYTSGDRFGSIMTLSNVVDNSGEGAFLENIAFLDKAKQASLAIDFLFFNALPTVASADNAAIDISDAEMEKCVGVVSSVAGDLVALANSQYADVKAKGTVLDCLAGSKDLYCVMVIRSAGTFAADSLRITFKFRKAN